MLICIIKGYVISQNNLNTNDIEFTFYISYNMLSLIIKFILIKYAFYCMKNKVIDHLLSALPVFKAFENDEDDDKFYSKLS